MIWVSSHRSLWLFMFQSFFCLFFRLDHSYGSIFKFRALFSVISILPLSLPSALFLSDILFFSSKISIWPFLIVSLFLLAVYLYFHFRSAHTYLMEEGYNGCFRLSTPVGFILHCVMCLVSCIWPLGFSVSDAPASGCPTLTAQSCTGQCCTWWCHVLGSQLDY